MANEETNRENQPSVARVNTSRFLQSESESVSGASNQKPLLYNRKHFAILGIGLGLVVLGFILMSGGSMPNNEVWQPELIYSFRRITLAPMVVLLGLCVVVYGIFKKNPESERSE